MKIVFTGSGSGGHIVPLVSIINQLKSQHKEIEIIFIGQKGDILSDLIKNNPNINKYYFIYAGKFRRYSNEGLKQLLDFATIYKNIRDIFLIFIGFYQSLLIIKKNKPDRIFTRGGYIAVPVAFAARLLKVDYITHDSDVVSSLANKIIAKGAKYNLVALNNGYYFYEPTKTKVVGIPVSVNFQTVDQKLKHQYRQELGIKDNDMVLLVVGGGLGSVNINNLMYQIIPELLKLYPKLIIFHVIGQKNFNLMSKKYNQPDYLSKKARNRLKYFGFLDNLYIYSGISDLIVSRAGATNIAEFAIQKKACIIIPSPSLPNSHQIKNAEYLSSNSAAIILDEKNTIKNPNILKDNIIDLLDSKQKREVLANNLNRLFTQDSINKIIEYILN